jgi:hypothetical protein
MSDNSKADRPESSKKKITGWTASILFHGQTVLVTVKADRRRDALRKLRRAFPEIIIDMPSEIRRTTAVPGRQFPGRREFDFEHEPATFSTDASTGSGQND